MQTDHAAPPDDEPRRDADAPAPGCCGGPPRTDASACCALDETRKARGEAGCGCGAAAGARGRGCSQRLAATPSIRS